jgi:hypothetical protein
MKSFLGYNTQSDKPENSEWMFRAEYGGDIWYKVFGVIKRTPKGCWVVPEYVNPNNLEDIKKYKRFIRNEGTKKYCYPTRDEADTAFYYRKRKQILILQRQLERAKEAFKSVDGNLSNITD